MEDPAAHLAQKVRVLANVGLEDARTLGQTALDDEVGLPQRIQRAIDGRKLETRENALAPLPYLLRRERLTGLEQRPPHMSPLRRDAYPTFLQNTRYVLVHTTCKLLAD